MKAPVVKHWDQEKHHGYARVVRDGDGLELTFIL